MELRFKVVIIIPNCQHLLVMAERS